MMIRAPIRPDMLRWARERAGASLESLRKRFPHLDAWESGDGAPTLKQLEAFAKAVWVPVGYLFLAEPPVERVPLPDFRSGHLRGDRPSANLLDTLYLCQARQGWYRDNAVGAGEPQRRFVGSLTLATPVREAATVIRDALGFDLDARRSCPTWTDALRQFIAQAETIGVMVMCSGVVFNNNRRKLDPAEFRGFAIADPLAPLVFINGADSKAAQMFTLAHELGHLWLGQSALSDADPSRPADGDVEMWCNQVAAELLVPEDVLRAELRAREEVDATTTRLARRFKVSTLVVLRRLRDIAAISQSQFREAYQAELRRIAERPTSSGGDFYLTQAARVSKRFASALVESTLEGRTLYRDAMRMLGVAKIETFRELGRQLHFPI
jgi:Zn-dependent peptidase ImmA (M78 family)/transcriptional regulator with XRE-family HTH domain